MCRTSEPRNLRQWALMRKLREAYPAMSGFSWPSAQRRDGLLPINRLIRLTKITLISCGEPTFSHNIWGRSGLEQVWGFGEAPNDAWGASLFSNVPRLHLDFMPRRGAHFNTNNCGVRVCVASLCGFCRPE